MIDGLLRMVRPAYALLGIPAIGDRLTAWTVGPDNAELIFNARQLMATTAEHALRDAA